MTQKYQGDVSIIKMDETVTKGLSFKKLDKPLTVAEGEITGHLHQIIATPNSELEWTKNDKGYFLRVKSGTAKMTHQEHGTIEIDKGIYYIGRQVEYDPIEKYRLVQD